MPASKWQNFSPTLRSVTLGLITVNVASKWDTALMAVLVGRPSWVEKRKPGLIFARSEAELTRFLLQDYFRALRADATLNFLSALRNKQLLAMQAGSYQAMKHLAESDSLRYKAGGISQIDAGKVARGPAMLNELITRGSRWKLSLLNMSVLTRRT